MANRYWIGPAGEIWNDTNTTPWAATSGGTGGQSVPTSADDVFFDANSSSAVIGGGNGDIQAMNNLNCTGYSGTWTGSGTNERDFEVYGNFTLSATMAWNFSNKRFRFKATGTGKTITAAGIQINGQNTNQMIFEGVGGGWTLQDDLFMTGDLVLTNGTLNLNGRSVNCRNLSITGTSARTLTMGASSIELNGSSGNIWDATYTTNLTLNADTSTIILNNDSTASTFVGGGLTYYIVQNSSAGGPTIIEGSNTFTNLTLGQSSTTNFTAGTTQTVSSFDGSGIGASNMVTMASTAPGSQWTISDTSGTNTVIYASITDSAATGGATWTASDPTNVNGGGNSGWVFAGFINSTNAYSSNNVYATITAASGDIGLQLSGDGGATWSTELTKTFTGAEGSQTYGMGSTELWGLTWTGDNVDDTSFRLRVHIGSSYQIYTTFGFAPTSTVILTGIEVTVEAKWDGATTSIDHIAAKIYYGTSTTPVQAGAIAYASDGNSGDGALVLYDETDNWIELGAAGGSGATTALDNLASVAINTSLISDTDNTDDLGSSAKEWKDLYIDGTAYLDAIDLNGTGLTSSGTQLNYLSSATGTTGTTNTNIVFSTSPSLTTPALGTPSALVGTNITGTGAGFTAGTVTTNANLTGDVTSSGNATTIATGAVDSEMLNTSIGFHAYRNAAKIIGNSLADIIHDTERFDYGSDFSTVTGAFTVPLAGTYLFTANVDCDATGNVRLVVNIVGSTFGQRIVFDVTATDINKGGGSIYIDCAESETVKVQALITNNTDVASVETYFAGFYVG